MRIKYALLNKNMNFQLNPYHCVIDFVTTGCEKAAWIIITSHDVIITSLLRRNDVILRNHVKMTSFWRNSDVIIM